MRESSRCGISAGIELRITPSIWPFWRRAVDSTLEFSGSRLRNAGPHPDRIVYMDRRRNAAQAAAGGLAHRGDVVAVLLHGSTVRGEALASSDIDLLVVTASDDALAGYWASVYLVHDIVEMLYAIADRPLPPGSRRFDLVANLPLADRHRGLFGELCAGPARRRISAAVRLVDELAPQLGPPPAGEILEGRA